MQKDRLVYIQILSLFVFVACIILFTTDASANLWQRLRDCEVYNQNWTIESQSYSEYFETLPTFFYTENNEQEVRISKTLENVSNGDCIGFFSFQQQVRIFLDGNVVYEFIPADNVNSSTPGNKWNFLPIHAEDNGKTVTIQIYECYYRDHITIPTMYYGTQAGITLYYMDAELPGVILSIIMILFGFIIGIFCLLYTKRSDIGLAPHWLALYALFRGVWAAIEANLYSFFWSHLLLFSQVSYLCLKLAVVTYLKFTNTSFHNGKNKVFQFLTACSIVDFWGTAALQFFGIADFANTVVITHVILMVGGIYACVIAVMQIQQQRKDSVVLLAVKRKNTYYTQLLCTIIIIVFSFIDMIRYYTTNSPDIAHFTRIGDIIYIIAMALAIFLDFIYLIQMGHKAAVIIEEASLDPMTKLRNRASYEKDLDKGKKRHWVHYGIVVMDLNNLKLFNDCHGHDSGDQYIVTASEYIRDTFSPWGNAYRIGGDEFCVIAEKLSEEKFLELQKHLEEQMASIHSPDDILRMEIASGYAVFESGKDSTLRDTMKRADELMYKRKQELKGEAGR